MTRPNYILSFRKLGLIFGIWTLLAMIPAIQAHYYITSLGEPITWRRAVGPAFMNHWIWAGLTPGVLWMSARFPIERRHLARLLSVHVLGGLAFAVLHVSIRVTFFPSVTLYTSHPPSHASWPLLERTFFANAYDDIWMYGTIIAFSQLWNYYRKYQEREIRASRLEAQLAQAQLTVLRMQLQPHFLFNTLHTISSLMHEDVEAADNMMARLSDLLRQSLDDGSEAEVTLKREMGFLEGYLAIQQVRFRDRLSVEVDIDPLCLDALVPNMILQPIVENAIIHGIAPRAGPGEVRIRSRRDNGRLRLEVLDNGLGFPAKATTRKGLGLANTRDRLAQLYGESQAFGLEQRPGGGTIVTMDLPFRAQSDSGPEGGVA